MTYNIYIVLLMIVHIYSNKVFYLECELYETHYMKEHRISVDIGQFPTTFSMGI